MGKRLGILLIMVLNLIMLIHVDMPHHHHPHHHIPYFSSLSYQLNAEKSQDDCCPHQEDQQPTPAKGGCCVLDASIIVFREQQNETGCIVCLHHHPNLLLQAVLWIVNCNFGVDKREDIHIPAPPYINHYHSILASQSLGLRAPPANV